MAYLSQLIIFSVLFLSALFHITSGIAQETVFFTHNSESQSYIDSNNELRGNPNGGNRAFYIELVREMMIEFGVEKIRLSNVSFKRGYINTQNKPNHAFFNVARNKQRESLFSWVGPIWTFKDYFLKHSETSKYPKSLDDAKKMSVCVVRGNVHDQELSKLGFKNLTRLNDYNACIRLVANKRIDLTPSALTSLNKKIRDAGVKIDDIEVTNIMASSHDGYIAFSKQTSKETIDRWQNILNEMKKRGRYDQLKKIYYNGTS